MTSNPQIELARRYVEQTGVSVFLTGKAGTGKTTFLRDVAAHCPKRHAVVAPTGVAAINAGGVTIHSFFQLPFDPYLPDVKELMTEYQVPDRYKSLNKTKLNIIRTLELLIIDEISMVRADLLDAIDMTLRRCRRSSRPFGGVQLLMIGDVHQLSPVVTERERPYMEQVYPTPYFFASKALQRMPYVTIELTTVYRQQDAVFIDLLNRVRNNDIDADTLQLLNSRVQKASSIDTGQTPPITLTTHNRQADAINRRHMEALPDKGLTFMAKFKGDYPEKALPCERELLVKEGERVMFLKNDSSGQRRYYNGLLGTVRGFEEEDGFTFIAVESDEGELIMTGMETWESMRYTLDPNSHEIKQEVEGSFSQYPLQAAWAVTIHKAQGLTFDRVSIDAADAFAFGQVYVALSRCRTLQGLTLTTPLSASVAFNDRSVSQFVSSRPSFEQTESEAPTYEQQYRLERLMDLFGMDELVAYADRLQEHYAKLRNIYPAEVESMQSEIGKILNLQGVSEKFKAQLMRLDETSQNTRAQQGAEYFLGVLAEVAAQLPSLLKVEVDNKETARLIDEDGKRLSEPLGLKTACLAAVAKQGYSVQTVQRAKAAFIDGDSEPKKKRERKAKSAAVNIGAEAKNLAAALRQWRSQKAEALGVPVYVVLQQKALQALASHAPLTEHELKQMPGIGPKTVEKYGAELLTLIHSFQNKNNSI